MIKKNFNAKSAKFEKNMYQQIYFMLWIINKAYVICTNIFQTHIALILIKKSTPLPNAQGVGTSFKSKKIKAISF